MTRAEIESRLVEKLGLKNSAAAAVVQGTLDCMLESLQKGEKVELRGFGSLRVRTRRERICRNPKTGAKVNVPARKAAYFKPGKALKDKLNP